MSKLNPTLHQELRLSIISFLSTVESADFKKLMEITEATKGNLSVQISKLEKAGYLKVVKSFKGNFPNTNCSITAEGKKEFEQYLTDLKGLLKL